MTRFIFLALFALASCNDARPSPTAGIINSLQLVLHDPSPDALGSPTNPVTALQATFDVIAVDENGATVAKDLDVDVFISFGGVKTGGQAACGADSSGNTPIETVHLTAGKLMGHTTTLPRAFGSTSIWLEEKSAHATGASPTIYFRNPYIDEVQTPADPTAANATFCSAFNNRFLIVDHARPGGNLVVSSVFSNAFSVVDTGAANFNYIYLFAFGKPPSYIQPGKVLTSFSGNYSKFVGFTELNFPLFTASPDGTPLAALPPNTMLTHADLGNVPKLLGASAGVVQFTGTVCDPSPPNPTADPNIQKTIDSWKKYSQFVIDADGTCASFTNFAAELPVKIFGGFDPTKAIGSTLTIVGMLQNHSGQNAYTDASGNIISCSTSSPCAKGTCIQGDCYKNAFNFWTILPRTPADIVSVVAPPPM